MDSYLEITSSDDPKQISRMCADINRHLNGNMDEVIVVVNNMWTGIKIKKGVLKQYKKRVLTASPREFKDMDCTYHNRAYYYNFDTYNEQSIPVFSNGYYTTKVGDTLSPSELTAGRNILSRVLYLHDFHYMDMTATPGELRRVYDTDSLNNGYAQQKINVLRDYLITRHTTHNTN